MIRTITFTVLTAIVFVTNVLLQTGAQAAAIDSSLPCLTEACVQEAAHLLTRMNRSVDPCDDFYEFVCGRYIAEADLPDDKPEIDPLSVTGDILSKQVKKMITEKKRHEELRPFTLLRKFYSACINTNGIEEHSVDQLKSVLRDLGGWPILEGDKWNESDWIELTGKLRQNGFNTKHFITIDVDINPKNSSEYIISVDQAANDEIAEDNLMDGLKDHLVRNYAKFMTDLVVLFGVDKEFATKEVNDVIEFRAKIAKILVLRNEHIRLIIAANETTVGELQQTYPTIPWLDLINKVYGNSTKPITKQNKAVLVTHDYISKFEKIISETPKRVQVNHAILQILRELVYFLPKSFRDREQKFRTMAFGITKALPRWDICMTKTTQYFNLAADALYIRRYVDEEARDDVTKMVSLIKEAFIKILKEVEWMDEETRRQAIEKADVITPYIAYPTELRDDKKLEDYYSELKFESNNIISLICQAAKFKRDKEIGFYGGPVVKNHWTIRLAAITSNAVYDPQANSIQIPSGIMQNEFYNKDRPKYMNYGGLGLVIGHEITHGFDDTGKQFDKNGNSINWWKSSTSEAYASKAKCFVEQYGGYTVPEVALNLNGETTLSENIADNGGVKEAYLAYLEWVKQNKEEPSLPALNYTHKQLFWISLASAWCSKTRPSSLQHTILMDEHLPNKYRIIVSLANMPHFVEDFNCPVGSKMNPVKKCQVW